jgi:hypothetical protein
VMLESTKEDSLPEFLNPNFHIHFMFVCECKTEEKTHSHFTIRLAELIMKIGAALFHSTHGEAGVFWQESTVRGGGGGRNSGYCPLC